MVIVRYPRTFRLFVQVCWRVISQVGGWDGKIFLLSASGPLVNRLPHLEDRLNSSHCEQLQHNVLYAFCDADAVLHWDVKYAVSRDKLSSSQLHVKPASYFTSWEIQWEVWESIFSFHSRSVFATGAVCTPCTQCGEIIFLSDLYL